MGLFIFRFWPAFIPLIIYWLWYHHVCRQALIMGQPKPRFRDGPWYWAVLSSLLIAAGCFLFLGASHESEKGIYVPPHMEGGTLVPGHIEK